MFIDHLDIKSIMTTYSLEMTSEKDKHNVYYINVSSYLFTGRHIHAYVCITRVRPIIMNAANDDIMQSLFI